MKKLFYSILIATFFVCSLSVFAGNDDNTGNGNTQNADKEAFVQMNINNLKADIELTAEQEEEIIGLLGKLYEDRAISAQKADRKEQIASKKLDYENYAIALDSVLTEEQRAELERKIEERKNGIKL
jgi:Spy/CpxP family protein refolding chaperone